MKKILVLVAMLCPWLWAIAQETEGRVTINKVERPAVLADYEFTADVVEAAVLGDLKSRGFGKGDTYKGFQRYTDIVFPDLSQSKIDLYVKVTGKSKKEGERSTLCLAVSKGPENFVSSIEDPDLIASVKQYMSGLNAKFEYQKLLFAIEEQAKVLEKAERKMNNLKDENASLQKRLKDTEEAIRKNEAEQNAQKAQVEADRKALDELKSRLK